VKLRAEAPAKINRELRVGRLRPDGFHEIRSRIVSIDLADSVEVETGDGSLALTCTGIPVPADESNLVARAAKALAERLGRPSADATIRLEKKIPVGAGLGGGSSDAARALVLLAELWGSRLSFEDLGALAASLGSDVPFFLVGGEADVTGRGERVSPLPDSPPVDLLVVAPGFSISTAEAYARRGAGSGKGASPEEIPSLEIESSGNYFGPNDLALAVLEIRPEMSILLESARSVGVESTITGSGSAVVVRGAAADAQERLASAFPESRIIRCRTLARQEYRLRTESSGGSQWTSHR
jgi:4-diphosphocytidyl-2-C-methyl-D-erythritol kinase